MTKPKTDKVPAKRARKPQQKGTPPAARLTPPGPLRESILPLVDIGYEAFEELCRDIIDIEFPSIDRSSLKRGRGVDQYGVDVEGFYSDGYPHVVLSAKCYKKVIPSRFPTWIEEFTKHLDSHWKDQQVKHFVLAVTVEGNDDDLNAEARKLVAELAARDIKFHFWHSFKITNLILKKSHLIDRYFNRYWYDALSADKMPKTPPIGGGGNGPITPAQSAEDNVHRVFLDAAAQSAQKELDIATTALRHGNGQPLKQWLNDKRSISYIWDVLPIGTRAEGLRAAAMMALGENDIVSGRQFLDDADKLQDPPDRTARAYLANATLGLNAALAELSSPNGRRERELLAGLEITDGRPNDAFNTLAPLIGGEVSSEVLRLRAIAKYRLGDVNAALNFAKSATEHASSTVMARFTLGIIRVGCALVNGVELPFLGTPNPISPSLVRFNVDVTATLAAAADDFDRLIESVHGDLKLDAEVWKLAALLLNQDTRSAGRDFARILMSRAEPDPIIVAWCLHYGLSMKRGRLRKQFGDRLRAGAGNQGHVVVLALLSSEKPKRALRIVERFAPLFPDAMDYFDHWREQFGGTDADPASSYAAAAARAVDGGDFEPLCSFLASEHATTETIMSGAELMSARRHFEGVNHIRSILLGLTSARSVEIAAIAAFNTEDFQASIDIVNDATAKGMTLSRRFVTIRLNARRALGQHRELIDELETFIRAQDDPELREQLLDAHLRIGNLERVKVEAERSLERGSLRGQRALQVAHALKHVAPEIARQMLSSTDLTALPVEFEGALLSLSSELGLTELQDKLVRRLVSSPEGSGSFRRFDSVEEVIEEIRKISDAYRGRIDEWLHGRVPAVVAMSGRPKDFANLFLADPKHRKTSIGEDIPMLLAAPSLPQVLAGGVTQQKRELRIDLGALLLADRLELLDAVEQAFEIWIADSLPSALVEFASHFGDANEDLIERVHAIRRSESAIHAIEASPDGAMTVDTFDDPDIPELASLTAQLAIRAYQQGHLTEDQMSEALRRLGAATPIATQPLPSEALVLSRLALMELNRSGVIEQLARAVPMYVLNSELLQLDMLIGRARDEERVGRQLNRLRQKVAEKLASGRWKTVVSHAEDEDEEEIQKPLQLRCLLEVLPTQSTDKLLWVEDRMLSRVVAANAVTVVPIMAELVKMGHLTLRQETQMRSNLRAWEYTFLSIETGEIATILERAPVVNGRMIENDDVARLRRWFARDIESLRYIDPNATMDDDGRIIGEKRRYLELNSLAVDLLDAIWKQEGSSNEERRARSSWIWSNLRIQYLPEPLGDPSPDARRLLTGLNVMQGLTMPVHALLNQEQVSTSLLEEYMAWFVDEVIEDVQEADPQAASNAFEEVASTLARILEDPKDVDDEIGRMLRAHMDRLVRGYLRLFPGDIADEIVKFHGLDRQLPGLTMLSLSVAEDLSIPVRELEQGIATATEKKKKKVSISAHSDGKQKSIELTVRTDESGDLALSINYEGRRYAIGLAVVAVVHPEEAERQRLLALLTTSDPLEHPLDGRVITRIASEKDVETRVRDYNAEMDKNYDRRCVLLRRSITEKSTITITDFDLPDPDILSNFLLVPSDFTGSVSDLVRASADALIGKLGIAKAMERLSSLPVGLPSDVLVQYASSLLAEQVDFSKGDPVTLLFTKALAMASAGSPIDDLIAPQNFDEFGEQFRVFKQLLRRAYWQASRSPKWASLPEEVTFVLAWVHADQMTRIASPVGYQPQELDRWFANQTPTRLVDLHRYRRISPWVQDVIFKSTSTRFIAAFVSHVIEMGVAIPDKLKEAVGRTAEFGFTPLFDIVAVRRASPPEYWLLQDAIPAFASVGWIDPGSPFAKRDPSELLAAVLDEDREGDPNRYAAPISLLLSIDNVTDDTVVDRLVERINDAVDRMAISDVDEAFNQFLLLAAEVYANRQDREAFKKMIVRYATAFKIKWPSERVRMGDGNGAGTAAANLLNATLLFALMGNDLGLCERYKDVVTVIEALVDAWPGVRLPALDLLNELGDQVDAQTAAETVWPTALKMRSG